MNRSCGGCTLCCKLMPVQGGADDTLWDLVPNMIARGLMTERVAAETLRDFDKPAGQRCPHQCSKGCRVYDQRPLACRFWSCAWVGGMAGTEKLGRPDRTRYVINPVPDYCEGEQDGRHFKIPVLEVWCDPNFPDAWRDPALLAYLNYRAQKDGFAALIRYGSDNAFFVAPPALTNDGKWLEKRSNKLPGPTHTWEQKLAVLGPMTIEFSDD
jgi:Fe-S-cluster containining protein